MIVALLLAATFAATYLTGPAGRDDISRWRARRRLELDAPRARVEYLPSASCRDDFARFARVEAVDPVDV